jgi:hypothetical protein
MGIRVVQQIDHIAIRVNELDYLFRLFSEKFQLPVVWPKASYGVARSGVLCAGNVNIEILQYGTPDDLKGKPAADSHLFAIVFEPSSITESLEELINRKITHSPPIPYRGTRFDGYVGELWTNILIGDLLDGSANAFNVGLMVNRYVWLSGFIGNLASWIGNSRWTKSMVIRAMAERMVFLTEYTHDVPQTRLEGKKKLNDLGGGGLGLKFVQEVIVGVEDFEGKQSRWEKLLYPFIQSSPGLWHLGEGPALRLVQSTADVIKALVLKVESLERASAYLNENNMLGTSSDSELCIAPSIVQGLDIRLVE